MCDSCVTIPNTHIAIIVHLQLYLSWFFINTGTVQVDGQVSTSLQHEIEKLNQMVKGVHGIGEAFITAW